MMLKVIVFVISLLVLDSSCSSSCNCGFGGLCINDTAGRPISLPCNVCIEISLGFYEPRDCSTVSNHCTRSTCDRGTCIRTFGSYYCECPVGWMGQKCDVRVLPTDEFVGSSAVHLYYQTQPSQSPGPHPFTIVYDLRERRKGESTYVQLFVKFSDGRIYAPQSEDFVMKNIKEECIRDALRNNELYDIQVCDYLPTGEVRTFTVDAFFSTTDSVPEDELLYIPALNSIVGRKSSIRVVALLQQPDQKETRLLFVQDYPIFSYFHPTVKKCLIKSEFLGCSTSVDKPYRYPREGTITIRGISSILNCEGVLIAGTEWYLQRHINPEDNASDKDFLPEPLGINSYHIVFEPFSLSRGIHMLEFIYHFRGQPPHHGGTNSFKDYSRCWIAVTGGKPNLITEGGNRRTMSCHKRMVLPLVNVNFNYKLSDFSIEINCNQTTDIDCRRSNLSVPVLRKSVLAECGKYYEYTFKVHWDEYEYYDRAFHRTISFKTIIHFIPTQLNLQLECLFNCYPIDPKFKLVMYAASHPYFGPRVHWSVTRNGTVVEITTNEVRAFSPLAASRILNLNPSTLVDDTARTAIIGVESSHDNLKASTDLVCDNLKYDGAMGYTVFFSDERRTSVSINVKSPGPITFPIAMYSVYEVNQLSKDHLPLLSTHYAADLKRIKIHWTSLRICVRDARHVEYCQDEEVEEGNIPENRIINMIDVEAAFTSKNVQLFLNNAIIYMTNLLTRTNASYFIWSGYMFERLHLISRANLLTVQGQKEANSALFMASIFFYSEDGNRNEGIHPFVWENAFYSLSKINPVLWALLRSKVLQFLERSMISLYQRTLSGRVKVDSQHAGNILEELIRVWSLAHAQEAYGVRLDQEFIFTSLNHDANYEVYLKGEIIFLNLRSSANLRKILEPMLGIISRRSRLFYGIRSLGLKHVRAWAMRSTYQDILNALNKSNERLEKHHCCSDYIFGNPSHLGPENELLRRSQISMPPPPEHWGEKEFIFVAMLVENRKGDTRRTPTLVIQLADKEENAIERFPGEFNITLPYMVNGSVSNVSHNTWKSHDLIVKTKSGGRTLRDFNAYKIKLPESFKDWELKIYHDSFASLKAKIFLSTAPDFEETSASPVLPSVPVTDRNLSLSKVQVKPGNESHFLPDHFYFGILPGEETLPSDINIYIMTSIYFCQIEQYGGKTTFCKGLSKNVLESNNIECHCDHFGLISAVELNADLTRIMLEQITFVYPTKFHADGKIIAALVMMLMMGLVMGFAFWKDHKRITRATLISLDDNYVKDSFVIIIGVYTGMRCLAGCTSQVAIKIEGSTSSSRVHVLQKRSQKTLRAGEDDWFMMITNKHLGNIKSIRIWLNFEKRPHWYCEKILLYDMHYSRWYSTQVRKWMELNDFKDDSRCSHLEMNELVTTGTAVRHGLMYHYLTELRNIHILASIFLLHSRSLSSFEQIGCILIMDIISIFWAIWLIEEEAYTWIYGNEYLDAMEASELIGATKRTFTTAMLGALMSGVVTFPIRILCRSIYISRFYQKRTTNPVYMDLILSAEASGKKSLFSFGGGSIHGSSSRKSTKIDVAPWNSRLRMKKLARVCLLLVFGPAQFRCINVDKIIFQRRAFWKCLILRISILLMALVLLAGIVYIELRTEYWKKIKSALFLTATAFLMDVFILNPFFILICSLVSVFGLKVSNTEMHFINEDAKMKHPSVISYKDYIGKATRKEYKLPLSTEIDVSRKKGSKIYSNLMLIHYIIALMFIVCCVLILQIRIKDSYSSCITIGTAWSQGGMLFDRIVPTIDKIYNKIMASDYVMASLTPLDATWYNGKPISKDGGRWGKERFSKTLGNTLAIIILMDNASEYEPSEFYDLISLKPCGYLSDNSQLTRNAEIHGVTLNHSVISTRTITGRSQEAYALAGHCKILETWPWDKYYSSLRLIMDDLINMKDSCEPRAVIFTINYFNTFMTRWNTLELLIEFLPTGFTSAVLNCHSLYIELGSFFSPSILNTTALLVMLLSLAHIAIIIILASTEGYQIFKEEPLKCFLFLAHVNLVVMYVFYLSNLLLVIPSIYERSDIFPEFVLIYKCDAFLNASLLGIVAVVLFEFCWISLKTIGTVRLKVTAWGCIRRAAAVLVIIISFNTIVKFCFARDSTYNVLRNKFMGPKAMKDADHDTILLALLSAAYLAVTVLLKLGTAVMMITYCFRSSEDVSWLESYLRKRKESRENRRSSGKAFSSTSQREDREWSTEKDRLQTKISFMN